MRGLKKEHESDAFLLRSSRCRSRATLGVAFAGEPAHPVPVLRDCYRSRPTPWSPTTVTGKRRGGGAHLPELPAGDIDRPSSLPAMIYCFIKFRAAATMDILDRSGFLSTEGRATWCDGATRAAAVYLRLRQGRPHAFPLVAAERDGRPDSGFGFAARGRGGEGRRVLHHPGVYWSVRSRSSLGDL